MKAEDLMIGDYCRVWYEGLCIKNKGTIVKVLGIDAEKSLKEKSLVGCAHCHPLDGDQFDGGIWCEYLDPIPLTAEILEKNGFESDTNMFGLCYYELSKSYIIDNRGDRFCFVKRFPGLRDSTFHVIDVKYVHELQHVLRLCGISKEIVLNEFV